MTPPNDRAPDYDGWARCYDDDTRRFGWAAPRVLADALGEERAVTSDLRVLDLGVGTGQASAAYRHVGAAVVGVDRSAAMLAAAAERSAEFHALVQHDLDEGPPAWLRAESFDVVLACGVLHFCRDRAAQIEGLARALAPGGAIAFTYVPPQARRFGPTTHIDAADEVERWIASAGLQLRRHERFVAYCDQANADDPVDYGLVVACDPRPIAPVVDPEVALDRTACIDREHLRRAVSRAPWSPASSDAATGSALRAAIEQQLAMGEIDPRRWPWPADPSPQSGPCGCDTLVVLAHPDDETVYSAGTLAGLVRAGERVELVVATDGAGGRGGEDLRRTRARELIGAAAVLGLSSLCVLGWADFGKYLDAPRQRPVTATDAWQRWGGLAALRQLVAIVRARRPRRTLGFDPELDPNLSLHGHHLAIGGMLAAAQRLAADPACWPELGAAWTVGEHRVLAPAWRAATAEPWEVERPKVARALASHGSQHYSTRGPRLRIADPTRAVVEVTRRLSGRCPWVLARAIGPEQRDEDAIDWRALADRVLARPRARGELVRILRAQAATRPPDPAVMRSLDRLADPRTVTVVAGQQVGVLGGPAFTLTKALAAVALAERLGARGIEAVPVFWLATQDADDQEVLRVPRPHGPDLRLPAQLGGRPVGGHVLGPEIAELIDTLVADAPGVDAVALRRLRACYAPGTTLAAAFAAWLAELTAGTGLVLLDPDDAGWACLGRGLLGRELLGPDRMHGPLAAARMRLHAAGVRETVPTDRDALQVFFVDDGGVRRRLRATPDGVAHDRGVLTRERVADLLEREPRRFTPAALFRPLLQDSALPTIACVAGPTERRYLGQLEEAYRWAGIEPPAVVQRPRVHVAEIADERALLSVGGREMLSVAAAPWAAIGRAGLPPAAGAWLASLEATITEVRRARSTQGRRDGSEARGLLAALDQLDAGAAEALALLPRAGRSWVAAAPRLRAHLAAASEGRPHAERSLTRAARELHRMAQAMLREGRRRRPEAIAAWRGTGSEPAPAERRVTSAELVLRHGLDLPRRISAALRRGDAAELLLCFGGEA